MMYVLTATSIFQCLKLLIELRKLIICHKCINVIGPKSGVKIFWFDFEKIE